MIRHRVTILAVGLLLGCSEGDGGFGPRDDHFVETMVELRRAAILAGRDTAQFEARKQEILEERGVTEDSLRAYVARRSADLEGMAAVWDSVNARLTVDRLQEQ